MIDLFRVILNTRNRYDSLLVFLGGQSNALGLGIGPPSNPYSTAIDGCKIWTGASFDTLEYNVNNDAWNTDYHGCELSLGYKLNELFGKTVYLVKYAIDGGAIDEIAGEDDFNPDSNELYPLMIDKVNAAYTYMKNSLKLNPYLGSIWIQGERDARFADSAAKYFTNFNLLKSSFSNDVIGLKWWLNVLGDGQRVDFSNPEDTFDIVVSNQESLIEDNSDITKIYLDGKTLNIDNLHYDSASEIDIGNEAALSIYTILNGLIH